MDTIEKGGAEFKSASFFHPDTCCELVIDACTGDAHYNIVDPHQYVKNDLDNLYEGKDIIKRSVNKASTKNLTPIDHAFYEALDAPRTEPQKKSPQTRLESHEGTRADLGHILPLPKFNKHPLASNNSLSALRRK